MGEQCHSISHRSHRRVGGRRLLSAAGVLALSTTALTSPANASVTGTITFACTASLPSFPTYSSEGTCDGGQVSSYAGLGAGSYAVVGAGDFHAYFRYAEPCGAGAVVPLNGVADGTAVASHVSAVSDGHVTTASISVPFSWTRSGATAIVLTGPATVTFDDGSPPAQAVTGGIAIATFTPVGVPGTCPGPGGPLVAEVVGTVVYAA
jgi:hypothetical protein